MGISLSHGRDFGTYHICKKPTLNIHADESMGLEFYFVISGPFSFSQICLCAM